MKSKTVGSLTVHHTAAKIGKQTYSDGTIEDTLLTLFRDNPDPQPKIDAILRGNPTWAETYHLSSQRENLLNWFPFGKDKSVIEIGAGCGPITNLLARSCKAVTAVELSERRAMVNAYRNQHFKNVEIVISNVEDYYQAFPKKKFDYATSIGVLEYAGRYISGPQPFHDFIGLMKQGLKKDGQVIIAIENKLGLKYWSGSREDHVQLPFESIQDYPHYNGIRTFGKQELKQLLEECGLADITFYYPVPDYKMPKAVYSDGFLPGNGAEPPYGLLPTPAPDQPRDHIFSEQLAMRSIVQNNLFDQFANSFLVVARKK